MTPAPALWKTLQRHVPKGQWVSTRAILSIVELHSAFDRDDLNSSFLHAPRWKVNVVRLLRKKRKSGSIQGRGRG